MLVMTATVFVLVVLDDTMNREVHAKDEEQRGADMTEPFLKGLQAAGQSADAHGAVTYQPRNQHDRKTRTQTEDHGHQPVPRTGQRQRDIYHRQKIDQTVRAKGNREENTQDKRP